MHILLTHSSVTGHLDSFHPWSVMNNAARSIHVQVLGWSPVVIFLEDVCRSGISESYGNSLFNFRGTASVFQTVPHFVPAVYCVPVSSDPH